MNKKDLKEFVKIRNTVKKLIDRINLTNDSIFESCAANNSFLKIDERIHSENDEPAFIYNGDKHWYIKGTRHRDKDLPAIEYSNGDKEWFANGKLHRTNDKPAIEYANGTKCWYLNGKRHRTSGAAIEHINGKKSWYLLGKCIKCNSLEEFDKYVKEYFIMLVLK